MPKSFLSILKRYPVFLISYLIFLVIALTIQLSIPKTDFFLWTNRHHTSFMDEFFKLNTYLGDGLTIIIIGLGLMFVKIRYGVLTLMAYAYTSVFVQVLKRVFHSPRPVKFFEGIQEIRSIEGYPLHQWNSFPSGHSVSAFTLAVILTYLLPYKNKHWILLPVAIITSFSRVYLAQHFFEDIVAGSVLGVILTFQLIWWLENSNWYNSAKLDGKLDYRLKRITSSFSSAETEK
ncbi:phosphatase PAP2 family protein [Daejeonella oryzae]|uniref:phosphatase PAP2 family protein n=1 Tax=Daejeonella oryzae TaxID=1122943 RepID=UPI0003F81B28|nr:phosphatase PAP2 family protein [Daejeonella oryzae]